MSEFAARHSHQTAEWFTPDAILEAVRHALGGRIDLDPCSCPEAQQRVKAESYYTTDGATKPWHGRVIVNPPGGQVADFWKTFSTSENMEAGIWVGYSIEQLQTLQSVDAPSPLQFAFCVPKRRIAFVEPEHRRLSRLEAIRRENADRAMAGKSLRSEKASPSHSNYLVYRGPRLDLFVEAFKPIGAVCCGLLL